MQVAHLKYYAYLNKNFILSIKVLTSYLLIISIKVKRGTHAPVDKICSHVFTPKISKIS